MDKLDELDMPNSRRGNRKRIAEADRLMRIHAKKCGNIWVSNQLPGEDVVYMQCSCGLKCEA